MWWQLCLGILATQWLCASCPLRQESLPTPGTPPTTQLPATPVDECANLTEQELAFAMQLSQVHRHIFCSQFTTTQRSEAMLMTTQAKTGGQKTVLTPDEAVEKVLQTTRGQTAPPPPPSKPKQPSLNIMK